MPVRRHLPDDLKTSRTTGVEEGFEPGGEVPPFFLLSHKTPGVPLRLVYQAGTRSNHGGAKERRGTHPVAIGTRWPRRAGRLSRLSLLLAGSGVRESGRWPSGVRRRRGASFCVDSACSVWPAERRGAGPKGRRMHWLCPRPIPVIIIRLCPSVTQKHPEVLQKPDGSPGGALLTRSDVAAARKRVPMTSAAALAAREACRPLLLFFFMWAHAVHE
ncbi:hypothetical protein HPB50_000376 [Hyalomma asiaticum]|uniref:Uncharacterized protein n=1 Tax=Hyalomma asiaticum TaxID=266040 RepID=A0ACB7SAK5_HYAAI|nr:hypothetical protein HPB50_000376 [Hyalomma asiaticum]